jgi:hypothetical protein
LIADTRSWMRLGPIAKSPRRLSPETPLLKELESENARLKQIVADKKTPYRSLEGAGAGELVSLTRRRRAVEHLQRVFGVSQRWASQLVGQPRSTQRHQPVEPDWDRALRAELRQLSWG